MRLYCNERFCRVPLQPAKLLGQGGAFRFPSIWLALTPRAISTTAYAEKQLPAQCKSTDKSRPRSIGPCGRTKAAMLRVAAYTGGRNVPSARFRIRQYIKPLLRTG